MAQAINFGTTLLVMLTLDCAVAREEHTIRLGGIAFYREAITTLHRAAHCISHARRAPPALGVPGRRSMRIIVWPVHGPTP